MSSSPPVDDAADRLIALAPILRRLPGARLPIPLTPLIGRTREIATGVSMLEDRSTRLLTLTGPGGVGKTRLALRIAEAVERDFSDGVRFVPLAAVRDPDLVDAALVRSLGLETGSSPLARLISVLRGAELLLVLDNFEHLLPAAPVVAELLTSCLDLTVLVTSRATLGIYGERQVAVPPMGLPRGSEPPRADRIGASEAVRLYVERSQAVQPDFRLTDANAGDVATICQRLDGLALAIELAAARSKMLSPGDVLERIDQRLDLMTGGGVDQAERQQTLRGAIAWSYDLLSIAEQRLFRRLAAFVGGFTLAAAEALDRAPDVTGETEEQLQHGREAAHPVVTRASGMATLDLVGSLHDKSLLWRETDGSGESRFGMLETIRIYGLEQLGASGAEAVTRNAHAAWCLALAERAEPEFYGPDQAIWFDRLTIEYPNLRSALVWTLEGAGQPSAGICLAVALGRFWHVGGQLQERQRWLERALARAPDADRRDLAAALCLLGNGALDLGDAVAARDLYERSLSIYRQLGDLHGMAPALLGLGGVAKDEGDLATAHARYEESLASRSTDPWWTSLVRVNLAQLAVARGDTLEARSLIDAALAGWRAGRYPQGIARALFFLAQLDDAAGDATAARGRYTEAQREWRAVGYRHGVAEASVALGWLALGARDDRLAASLFSEGLQLWREMANARELTRVIDGVAAIAAAQASPALALRLAGGATVVSGDADAAPPLDQARSQRWLRRARRALGAAADDAWMGGQQLPADAIVAEAASFLATVAQPEAPVPEPPVADDMEGPTGHGLTTRELEVLRLLARGQSNQAIADSLSISPRTATTHVANILGKLGVDSRAGAAAFAVRHRLDGA